MSIQLIIIVVTVLVSISLYFIAFSLPKPYDSKTIVFMRHGARTPSYYAQNQQYWNNYDPGHLTEKGFQQMIALGEHYKEKIFQNKFGKCEYEEVQIQSSTKQRSAMSAIGFVTGLCPENYGQILQRLFKEHYYTDIQNNDEFQRILGSNFSDPFAYNFSIFHRPHDFIFQSDSELVCPLSKLIISWMQSQKSFTEKQEEFKERLEFDEILPYMQIYYPNLKFTKRRGNNPPNIMQMKKFYGIFICSQFEEFEQPKLSYQAQQFIQEVYFYYEYTVSNSQHIQHKIALSELSKQIIKELYSNIPLSVYIGHELNLISILSILIDEQIYPPFAANLELSIYGDYVNVYFLGERIKTKLCSSGINCSRQEVVTYLEQYIVEDLQQFCRLP